MTGGLEGFGDIPGVWHYAPDRHVLERRCAFPTGAWDLLGAGKPTEACLVALTSIHWRESWKYGERAFRYCQHDLGHAIAALSLSAALCGWRLTILPAWSHGAVATLAGLDRDEDYFEAEREEPACVLLVSASGDRLPAPGPADAFLDAVRRGDWSGRASQLSADHVAWRFIDDVARATEDRGRADHERASVPVRANGADRGSRRRGRPVATSQRGRARWPVRDDARAVRPDALARHARCRGSVGCACGGRRAFISRCSCIASRSSPPGSICWCAIESALPALKAALSPAFRLGSGGRRPSLVAAPGW